MLALWGIARSEHAVSVDDEQILHQLLDHDPGSLLVAEDDGEIVASLIAAWDGWRANLYRLAVAPEHRRRGLATRLVSAGEERLRALGARRVTALVGLDGERARNMWISAGYAFDPEIGRHVRNI
ncbi:MAG: GNAT family N-acetyltransferase [Actinomycetota bacterium]|nr:GNAT family N-acetyltransferase [Actinomycetota bacterium]